MLLLRTYRPSPPLLTFVRTQVRHRGAGGPIRRPTRRIRHKHEALTSQSNPPTPPNHGSSPLPEQPPPPPPPTSTSTILASTDPSHNNLLSPVHIAEDANAILKSDHPATNILAQSGLVVERKIEMMNLFLGFEQANRYVIMDPHGNHIGYMAEHDGGFGKTMGRQWFKTHRAFTTHVFDRHQKEVLRFHRPFSWINSSIKVYDPLHVNSNFFKPPESISTELATVPQEDPEGRHISPLPLDAMRLIGEAQSEWAPLRRKYNLFLTHDPSLKEEEHQASQAFMQFAKVDEPVLSFDFSLRGHDNRLIGSVNRSFGGFAREIFTDTGVYALRMDSAALAEESENAKEIVSSSDKDKKAYAEVVGGKEDPVGMTLDQRAVMLATAVTVDFDYFSRHSHGSGMMGYMPFWFWGGGGEAAAAEVGAAETGVITGSEAVGGAVGNAGRAAGGVVAGEEMIGTGMAAAGTVAGYEAMQRAGGRGDNAPQSQESTSNPTDSPQQPQDTFGQDPNDAWGAGDHDPWQPGKGDGGSGGGGGGEGGGGLIDSITDFFL